jgi:hypothetical protein
MMERALADGVVLAHLAFIAFVFGGGLLVWLRPWVALVHLPALAWGIYVELTATICPLTPVENALRRAAGQAGYEGTFVDHYVVPIVYPPGLTPGAQALIGAALILLNAAVYLLAWRRARSSRACGAPTRSSALPGR